MTEKQFDAIWWMYLLQKRLVAHLHHRLYELLYSVGIPGNSSGMQ